jgi:oligopeptide/dipeptide ABC transporter ATP-binding protein
MTSLLELRGVEMRFPLTSPLLRRTVGWVRAVDGVDLTIDPGVTIGLVGESGSGKSTLGRIALGVLEPSSGSVLLDGTDLTGLRRKERQAMRRQLQFVFQDPYSSLDPFTPVGESVAEPARTHRTHDRAGRRQRVRELFELVGLRPETVNRYPREFSGGQLQRISIARSLMLDPKVIVLDEPVSSLDVSTQGEVINLLADIQERTGVSYLFISHDLAVVKHVSDRIAVMYLGRIVEEGPAAEVVNRPKHPYTLALLSAVPGEAAAAGGERIVLRGDLPSPTKVIPGCRFHTRCPFAMDICRTEVPAPFTTADGTSVECHLHTEGPKLEGRSVAELDAPAAAARAALTGFGPGDRSSASPARSRSLLRRR